VRRVDWRAGLDRLRRLWSRSLRLRTVAITVALSAIAVTVIGAYISTSVRTNLFESRKDQVVIEAGRAATSAQEVFTAAGEASGHRDPNVQRLEQELADKLGAKVAIKHSSGGKGRLVVSYNSLDELDGILAHIR